ncbi:MAG: response regulator [Anaerolineae bacterium]|nr:response regulator [Anaerolineae bacterium]
MSETGRILVIDDEPGMREGCRRALSAVGYQVDVAADGEEGWRRLQEGGWDLALVDIRLPGLDGLQLLEHIQNLDPDLVCLVITGYATLETAIQATKRGAYDLLPKPFTSDELLLAVRQAMERRRLVLDMRRLREERERDLMLLAEERSRLRTVLDSLSDGVLVANREGRLALFNPAALHLLGLPEPPPIGTDVAGLLPDPRLAQLIAEGPQDAQGRPASVAREVSRNGLTLLASVAPVFDQRQERLGTVTLLRDITAAKALDELKSQFVSMTSHELRTPLAAVQTYIDTLLGGFAGELTDQQRGILERCSQRLTALVNLVDDLLDVSRLESGRVERQIVTLDVCEVMREVVALSQMEADARQVSLRIEAPPEGLTVEMDRDDLVRVLSNLVNNGIKYNRPGGMVTLRARDEGYYARLDVVDTGIGIPKEALPRLFGEFYRVKRPETASIPGTGLGLSIVRRTVEFYKGRVEVKSRLGEGSTFTVLLPRGQATFRL